MTRNCLHLASLFALVLVGAGMQTAAWPQSDSSGNATHSAHGILLSVDPAHRSLEVSCEAVPDYMDAMEMGFRIRDKDLKVVQSLKPGNTIRFVIRQAGKTLYAEQVEVESSAVFEPEPMEASGLSALRKGLHPGAKALSVGEPVPDFSLTDQRGARVSLSDFRGRVVALTFGYSRCPNPNYCYRLSNNLAHVQRKLGAKARKDLVLLTIAMDPEHDQGEVLTEYAQAFHADPEMWHFLTGPLPEIKTVAGYFGVDFWTNDGLITHTLHTVVIDRQGKIAANLEGNHFAPQQLTDLVQSVIDRR